MSKKIDTIADFILDTRRMGAYSLGEAIDKVSAQWRTDMRRNGLGVYRIRLERIEETTLPDSTENFSLAEFACKDGSPVPDEMRDDTLMLMANLEVLRKELGDKAIRIVSGYRSPEYNAKVGGSKGSKHMLAQAADIRVSGVQPKIVADTIERLIKAGDMQEGGLGRYAGFTHYDIRGKRARWGKN